MTIEFINKRIPRSIFGGQYPYIQSGQQIKPFHRIVCNNSFAVDELDTKPVDTRYNNLDKNSKVVDGWQVGLDVFETQAVRLVCISLILMPDIRC